MRLVDQSNANSTRSSQRHRVAANCGHRGFFCSDAAYDLRAESRIATNSAPSPLCEAPAITNTGNIAVYPAQLARRLGINVYNTIDSSQHSLMPSPEELVVIQHQMAMNLPAAESVLKSGPFQYYSFAEAAWRFPGAAANLIMSTGRIQNKEEAKFGIYLRLLSCSMLYLRKTARERGWELLTLTIGAKYSRLASSFTKEALLAYSSTLRENCLPSQDKVPFDFAMVVAESEENEQQWQ